MPSTSHVAAGAATQQKATSPWREASTTGFGARQMAFSDRLQSAMHELALSGRKVVEQVQGGWTANAVFPAPTYLPQSAKASAATQATPRVEEASAVGKANAVDAPAAPDPAGKAAAAATTGRADATGAVQAASPLREAAQSHPMSLAEFPRPVGDNGRGMHWIPTTYQSPEVVDRFVNELKEMKIKWAVFLNDDTQVGANDYLVSKLVDAGIMPVMRVYTPEGSPIKGDLTALVKHYLPLGVKYYQLYNEPNLAVENEGRQPDVQRYLDLWIPAAKEVAEAGGLPGFGALAPGGDADDLQFLKDALTSISRRGEGASLDKAWLSMHNYMFNRPLDYNDDSNGFSKFRWYDDLVRAQLGRSMPIIGTEGGSQVGANNDGSLPPLGEGDLEQRLLGAYDRVAQGAEPYNFAYTYWLIANEEGGGSDPAFSHQALFRSDGTSPLVAALKANR
ncbi:MAG: hypothetical protein ACYC1C_17230 [Chloroflexota bacterium]